VAVACRTAAREAELDEIAQEAVTLAGANTGADITYVDPRLPFLGGSVCDATDEDDINALLFATSKFRDKPESFHPTQAGQDILANTIEGAVSGAEGSPSDGSARAGTGAEHATTMH
jgi:hypothetical protein